MTNIDQHFEAYSAWRQGLFKAVGDFRSWLQSQELADVQVDQRLDQVLSTLRDDKLYVAFVAEFSRGKSELINAIFFAAFGQRVLPSSAGRTTMCPTELMYEKGSAPCIRLLPIETRASGTSVAELRGFAEEWTTIPLDIESPDKVAHALQHIAEIKKVTKEIAQTLGLHIAEEETQNGMHLAEDGMVEVPRWRHAIINFPHPLLDQGARMPVEQGNAGAGPGGIAGRGDVLEAAVGNHAQHHRHLRLPNGRLPTALGCPTLDEFPAAPGFPPWVFRARSN